MIAFFDTNVLVYAFDQNETSKQSLALIAFQRQCITTPSSCPPKCYRSSTTSEILIRSETDLARSDCRRGEFIRPSSQARRINSPLRSAKTFLKIADISLNGSGFLNITTRKLRPALIVPEVQQQVRHLCAFEVLGSSVASIMSAMDIVQRYQLQWWDALVLEAALRAKADVLYSEDFQNGQCFGVLTVANPFLA